MFYDIRVNQTLSSMTVLVILPGSLAHYSDSSLSVPFQYLFSIIPVMPNIFPLQIMKLQFGWRIDKERVRVDHVSSKGSRPPPNPTL